MWIRRPPIDPVPAPFHLLQLDRPRNACTGPHGCPARILSRKVDPVANPGPKPIVAALSGCRAPVLCRGEKKGTGEWEWREIHSRASSERLNCNPGLILRGAGRIPKGLSFPFFFCTRAALGHTDCPKGGDQGGSTSVTGDYIQCQGIGTPLEPPGHFAFWHFYFFSFILLQPLPVGLYLRAALVIWPPWRADRCLLFPAALRLDEHRKEPGRLSVLEPCARVPSPPRPSPKSSPKPPS